MDTTIPSENVQGIVEHPKDSQVFLLSFSAVISCCVFIVIFVVLRRTIIRRRFRTNEKHSSIYVISVPIYQLKVRSEKPVPDIERVTQQKVVNNSSKNVIKENLVLNSEKSTKKPSEVAVFPREPVYKSQQTPSYIVPFSELPQTFDFSLANVEVHSDFVIIKDLRILQTYWYQNQPNPT